MNRSLPPASSARSTARGWIAVTLLAAAVTPATVTAQTVPTTTAPVAGAWGPPERQSLQLPTRAAGYASTAVLSPVGGGLLAFTPFEIQVPLTAAQSAPRVAGFDVAGRISGAASALPWSHAVFSRTAGGDGRALALRMSARTTDEVQVAAVSASGRLHHSQRVQARDRLPYSGVVCAGPGGDGVVVWSERSRRGPTRLAMARIPAHGPISRRIQLTTTTPWAYDCAVGPDGRWALVAAVRPESGDTSVPRLRYWTGFATRGLQRGLDLGTAPYETGLRVQIDGAGRSFVAWRNKIPGTDFDSNDYLPFKVRVTSVAPDGRSVTPTQILETGNGGSGSFTLEASPLAGAAMSVLPDTYGDGGDASPDQEHGIVRLTTAAGDGVFAPLTDPIVGTDDDGPIVFSADGTPFITWSDDRLHEYLAAAFPSNQLGPIERTGLSDDGVLSAGTAPDGEPRLISVHTTKSKATVVSVSR